MGRTEIDLNAFTGSWSTKVSKYMRAFENKYKGTGKVVNPHDKEFELDKDELGIVATFLDKVAGIAMPEKPKKTQSANEYAKSALKARKEANKILMP